MKISIKTGAVALLAILAISSIALRTMAACNAADGREVTVTLSGSVYVAAGSTNLYTLGMVYSDGSEVSSTDLAGATYTWTATGFTVVDHPTDGSVRLEAPEEASSAVKTIKCEFLQTGWSSASDCSDSIGVTVVEVDLEGYDALRAEGEGMVSEDCEDSLGAYITDNDDSSNPNPLEAKLVVKAVGVSGLTRQIDFGANFAKISLDGGGLAAQTKTIAGDSNLDVTYEVVKNGTWALSDSVTATLNIKDGTSVIGTDSVKFVNAKVKLTDGATVVNEDVVRIMTTPAMPDLTASLLGVTQATQVEWRLHISYHQGNRQDDSYFPGPDETTWTTLAKSAEWDIANLFGQNYYGGDATIVAKIDQVECTRNFKIHGLNPTQADVRGQLASLRHHLIAWKESRFQQFRDNHADVVRNHSDGPFTVLRTPDNGFGIMQLTAGSIPINQLWNWQANVDEGESRIDGFTTAANTYNDQVQQGLLWNGTTGGSPPNEGTAYPNASEFTADQLDRETWARYNSGYRYHDYDPNAGAWVNRDAGDIGSGYYAPGNAFADDLATWGDNIQNNQNYPPLWGN